MKAPAIFQAIVCLSGWAVAAWLMFGTPLEPIPLATPKERHTPMLPPAGVEDRKEDRKEDCPDNRIENLFIEWSADPALAGALVGFCLLDEAGKVIFSSPLAETALCPASTLKTVITAAALELLGEEFRFESFLHPSAEIDGEGALDGDLVFTGSGDPTLLSDDLERMAEAFVSSHGLKRVRGGVKVDASCFPAPPVNDHWNWGDIGNAYGAGAFGVNVDRNRMVLRFAPGGKPGDPVKLLDAKPMSPQPEWDHQVTTGPAGSGDRVMVYSEPYGRRVTLRGTVPAGQGTFHVNAAIPNPPKLVEEILIKQLGNLGVVFEGRSGPDAAGDPDTSPWAIRHPSAVLPEIIDHLHRVSDNLEAQCLFLTIGKEQDDDPAEVIRRHWESRGIAFTGLRLIDGSGLARANMIRPLDLARVNHLARRGPHGERFRQSLSSYLDGKVRSKLGAMSGVKTEVGFLTLEDGREVTFSLLANGLDLKVDFWSLRESFLRAVATNSTR